MNVDIRRQIDSIEFTLFGNREIKNISALGKDSAGIDRPEMFDGQEPKRGGLIDTRMGTTDENIICGTCGLNASHCCGHFGHIVLEVPLFNVIYLQHVKKILSCVCIKCSKLLVSENDTEIIALLQNKQKKQRLSAIGNIASGVTYCQRKDGCGAPVPKLKIEHKKTDVFATLVAEFKTDGKKEDEQNSKNKQTLVLTSERCYHILKNISDADCRIMGLNPELCRPEDMIHKIFPVPPVPVRPSVRSDGSSLTREDDITKNIGEIVKKNAQVSANKAALITNEQIPQNITSFTQLLQYRVGTCIDSDSNFVMKDKSKEIKSLASRLKGKEGIFRNNLMGKRVDFSARTVITPDPSIDINQVGVPLVIAMNLTYPEVVTPYNIEKLQKLVINGTDTYPGANYVILHNSGNYGKESRFSLRFRKDKVELHYGDIVERHLDDTDIVLLNRQPTLHKQSMMGHYVHVIKDPAFTSFRVNVGVTAPYNADFDGIMQIMNILYAL